MTKLPCSDQPTGRLALVFELMDMNIYELIRGRSHYVAEERIRRYMYQLIKAMDHMHKAGIFHRSFTLHSHFQQYACCVDDSFGTQP